MAGLCCTRHSGVKVSKTYQFGEVGAQPGTVTSSACICGRDDMRIFTLLLASAVTAVVLASASTGALAAQKKGAKATCPGGMSACIDVCIKRGGQPRFCPTWCQREKHC
jgi:hypothetical protein